MNRIRIATECVHIFFVFSFVRQFFDAFVRNINTEAEKHMILRFSSSNQMNSKYNIFVLFIYLYFFYFSYEFYLLLILAIDFDRKFKLLFIQYVQINRSVKFIVTEDQIKW